MWPEGAMFSAGFSLFVLLQMTANGEELKVYHFNKNLAITEMNKIDGALPECLYYRGDFSRPDNLTFCYRWTAFQYTTIFRILFLMQIGKVNSDLDNLEEGLMFSHWDTGPWLAIKLKGKGYNWIGHVPIKVDLHEWMHTCFTYSLITGSYKLVQNGKLVFQKNSPALVEAGQLLQSPFNMLSVGCVTRKDYYKFSSMHGKLTDVQVWDTELGSNDLEEITSCKNIKKYGSLFNWQSTPWIFDTPRKLSVAEVYQRQKICSSASQNLLFLPISSNFEAALNINCGKFSGILAGYMTKLEFIKIGEFLSHKNYFSNRECQFRHTEKSFELLGWLRLTDNDREGEFRDVASGKVPEYLPWQENAPVIGGVTYNCLTYSLKVVTGSDQQLNVTRKELRDEDCALKRCSICEVATTGIVIHVRGLCTESTFDTKYYYTVSENGSPIYIGITTSAIWYDDIKNSWIWADRKQKNSVATSNSRLDSFFIGNNLVDFHNTTDLCIKDQIKKVLKIKLTTCVIGDQYTCDNGLCISMEKRCDQKRNCEDGSDEFNCKLLDIRNNYNRLIPPFTFDSVLNEVRPASVSVVMTILKFLKIAEVDHSFSLKFVLAMEWYDYRIKYHNLKPGRSANALTFKEYQSIWIPNLIFSNTRKNDATVGTKAAIITITREGNYTRSGQEEVEEINIFEGKENRLTFEITYTKVFECEFQLSMYPFDMQTCSVDLTVNALEEQSLKIVPKKIQLKGSVRLTQYIVTSWKLVYRNNSDPSQGIHMVFQLKRRVVNELLTSYLPTTIILLIVYCTNYFKLSHFNTALTINLTSMLVLTTLFIGVSNPLPRVAYIKVRQLIKFFV